MKKTLLIFTCTILLSYNSNAQFGRIFDKATDKINDKISEEINNAIYREIEKRVMKSVDEAMDDMLRERYRQDSLSGKTTADYSGFLSAFMTPVELPDSYTFDMVLIADTKDYDGTKSTIEFMITKDGSLMGIKQLDGSNTSNIIIDLKNDVMATYTEEDGKKQVIAIPNMLTIGGGYIKANVDEVDMEVKFEKTGKTKKIEGYKCEEYLIEDEETKTKAYIATEFPISWRDSHGQFLNHIMPTTRREQMPEGMALKSESKTKKKNKKSSFEVKEIIDEPIVIDNTEYEQINYADQKED